MRYWRHLKQGSIQVKYITTSQVTISCKVPIRFFISTPSSLTIEITLDSHFELLLLRQYVQVYSQLEYILSPNTWLEYVLLLMLSLMETISWNYILEPLLLAIDFEHCKRHATFTNHEYKVVNEMNLPKKTFRKL